MFHLFTHAFFKACLFLGSGSVSHAVHTLRHEEGHGRHAQVHAQHLRDLPHRLASPWPACRRSPASGRRTRSSSAPAAGASVAPAANGAYTLMLIMGLVGAALTAAYMTRVIYLTFFGEYRGHGDTARVRAPASPCRSSSWPVLAVVRRLRSTCPGFVTGRRGALARRFEHYVEPHGVAYFPAITHAEPSWSLAISSTLDRAASASASAYWYYFVKAQPQGPRPSSRLTTNRPLPRPATRPAREQVLPRLPLHRRHRRRHQGPDRQGHLLVQPERASTASSTPSAATSVKAGQFVYDKIDQRVDRRRRQRARARRREAAGAGLRQIQTGKVQQYAAILFAGARRSGRRLHRPSSEE